MSPFPIEMITRLQSTAQRHSAGEPTDPGAALDDFIAQLNRLWPALDHNERLELVGTAVYFCEHCQMWQAAASLLDRLCVLAEAMEPLSANTMGDYMRLGDAHSRLSNWGQALAAYDKALSILNQNDSLAEWKPHLEQRRQVAADGLGDEEEPQAERPETPLGRVLRRRRRE